MTNQKLYDLEARTLEFAKSVRDFLKTLPKTQANIEYSKQLIRSSASVGANYIEANESLSKKDFLLRVKISKKEAKESCYWLNLIEFEGKEASIRQLLDECTQLMKILGAIVEKAKE